MGVLGEWVGVGVEGGGSYSGVNLIMVFGATLAYCTPAGGREGSRQEPRQPVHYLNHVQ